ncbi:MAG: hypothetical protein R2778_04285 [Saprospiraceae bacterium]
MQYNPYLRFIPTLIFMLLLNWSSAQKTSVQNIDANIEALMKKMTLDEKIGQLLQVPGDISTGTDVQSDDLLKQVKTGMIGSILSHTNFDNKIKIQRAAMESR